MKPKIHKPKSIKEAIDTFHTFLFKILEDEIIELIGKKKYNQSPQTNQTVERVRCDDLATNPTNAHGLSKVKTEDTTQNRAKARKNRIRRKEDEN